MQLQKRQSPTKKWLLIGLIVFGLVAGGGAAAWYVAGRASLEPTNEPRGINDIDYSPATKEEQQESEAIKENYNEPNQPPTDPSTPAPPIGLSIIRAGQVEQTVQIRTLISDASSGSCQATLNLSGQPTVSKTFPIAFEATSASCNGDIPLNELSAPGDWELSITATSGARTSATIKQTIKVNK
jgi:hypothetical protein